VKNIFASPGSLGFSASLEPGSVPY